jgi:hypothetical protein
MLSLCVPGLPTAIASLNSRHRIVVSTPRCGRGNPGSNPGGDTNRLSVTAEEKTLSDVQHDPKKCLRLLSSVGSSAPFVRERSRVRTTQEAKKKFFWWKKWILFTCIAYKHLMPQMTPLPPKGVLVERSNGRNWCPKWSDRSYHSETPRHLRACVAQLVRAKDC